LIHFYKRVINLPGWLAWLKGAIKTMA